MYDTLAATAPIPDRCRRISTIRRLSLRRFRGHGIVPGYLGGVLGGGGGGTLGVLFFFFCLGGGLYFCNMFIRFATSLEG